MIFFLQAIQLMEIPLKNKFRVLGYSVLNTVLVGVLAVSLSGGPDRNYIDPVYLARADSCFIDEIVIRECNLNSIHDILGISSHNSYSGPLSLLEQINISPYFELDLIVDDGQFKMFQNRTHPIYHA